ncbi:MAG: hypothetical protein WD061_01540 [Candidatus Saccharimonadales bacterium]
MSKRSAEFFTLEEQAQTHAVFKVLDVKGPDLIVPKLLMKIEADTTLDNQLLRQAKLAIGMIAADELVELERASQHYDIRPASWREVLLRADGFMSKHESGLKRSIKVVDPEFLIEFIDSMADIDDERGDYEAAESLRAIGEYAINNMNVSRSNRDESIDDEYPDERGSPYL